MPRHIIQCVSGISLKKVNWLLSSLFWPLFNQVLFFGSVWQQRKLARAWNEITMTKLSSFKSLIHAVEVVKRRFFPFPQTLDWPYRLILLWLIAFSSRGALTTRSLVRDIGFWVILKNDRIVKNWNLLWILVKHCTRTCDLGLISPTFHSKLLRMQRPYF